jgi:hypothetical protein
MRWLRVVHDVLVIALTAGAFALILLHVAATPPLCS